MPTTLTRNFAVKG